MSSVGVNVPTAGWRARSGHGRESSVRRVAYWALLAFIFSIPMENTLHLPAVGRVSKALGLVVAAVWVVDVLMRRGFRKPHPFHAAFGVFVIWSGLTFYWSVDPDSTRGGLFTYTQIFVMLIIIWDLIRSRITVQAALQAYVLGAWVASASLIRSFLSAPPSNYPQHDRLTLANFEVDGIALILAIAIPAAWFLAHEARRWTQHMLIQAINFAYLPAGVFALILTGTRGAAVASIPSILFVLWSVWRTNRTARIVTVGAVVLTVFLIVTVAPTSMVARIASAATNPTDTGGRSETWSRSLNVFALNPIVGVGLDSHRTAAPQGFHISRGEASSTFGREAHNTLISVLVETGLIGILLFGTLAVILIRSVSRLSGFPARYWITQLAVVAIGGQSLSLEDSKSVWLFCGLAVASAVPGVLQYPKVRSTRNPALVGARKWSSGPVLEPSGLLTPAWVSQLPNAPMTETLRHGDMANGDRPNGRAY